MKERDEQKDEFAMEKKEKGKGKKERKQQREKAWK